MKPKNLVRVTRKIRLIDLDMAFVVASGVGFGVAFVVAFGLHWGEMGKNVMRFLDILFLNFLESNRFETSEELF